MKNKLSLSLIITVISFSHVFSQTLLDDFDYWRVHTHFNGSAYNGRSILVFGDYGIITRSTDGGQNWTQTALPDSFNIKSIVNIGLRYFGVLNRKYAIKSVDNGESFLLYDFGNVNFFKALPYNDNIYFLSDKKIFVCNANLDVIKEYPIASDTSQIDFTIAGDDLIYTAGKGKLTVINLLTEKITNVNLQNLGICNDCPIPTNLFSASNIIYFVLDTALYSYDMANVKLSFTTNQIAHYAASNGELFNIYSFMATDLMLDSLYFNRINKSNRTSSRINKTENDRYISFLSFNNLNFLSKDTVIAVGNDLLIYISYDRGRTWLLKSHFKETANLLRLDSKNAVGTGQYAKFIKTTDGGITWLPQKNYLKEYTDNSINRSSTGMFFCKNKDFVIRYYHTNNQLENNFAFSKDGGETVFVKNSNDMIGYPSSMRLFYPSVNKNRIIFPLPSSFQVKWKFTMVFRLDDELEVTAYHNMDSAHVLFMDTFGNDELYSFVKYYRMPRHDGKQWIFDNTYLSLLKSEDTAVTWNSLKDLSFPKSYDLDRNIEVFRINDNYVFGIWDSTELLKHICKLNINTLELERIHSIKNYYFGGIKKTGGNTYLYSYNYGAEGTEYELLKNEDFENNPSDWKKMQPHEKINMFFINVFQDSLVCIYGYDNRGKQLGVWFAKPKKTTSVEMQAENRNYLYFSAPAPNPAKDYVKAKLFWNQSDDISKAEFTVYNILGNAVSQKSQFEFARLNAYSGEVLWNCRGNESGVYLLTARIGQHTRSISIIVAK